MKIAFISYECPPEAGGGIGTYVLQAATMLADRGHHVEVFAGSPHRASTDELSTGVKVYRVGCPDRRKFPVQITPVFADRHREVRFDVLEGPDYMAEATEAREAVPDLPFVVKLHTPLYFVKQIDAEVFGMMGRLRERYRSWRRGLPPEWSPSYPVNQREMQGILTANRIASPSQSIGERVTQEWGASVARTDFFPYPFTPLPSYLDVPIGSDTQVVTFVGRLEIRKGVINLARAIPLIRRACPGVRFRFVGGTLGSPSPRQTMLEYLQQLLNPHADIVEFLGRRDPEELPGILADTAVCIFPSLWESFGYVCLEAMAAGRAVVASQNCGLAELLDQGKVGRLIDPRQPEDIAARVIELLQDGTLRSRLGDSARERVLSVYSPAKVGPVQEASYERAISSRSQAPVLTAIS